MLSVKDLKRIAASFDRAGFEKQLGPFVLIHRPTTEFAHQQSMKLGASKTVALSPGSNRDKLSLLLQLDECLVSTLPPMSTGNQLLVGRMPDCEIVVDDPSVSKNHARLTWLPDQNFAMLEDLNSSNGTRVNGLEVKQSRPLNDADELSFGDARFCFLRTTSLHARLLGH